MRFNVILTCIICAALAFAQEEPSFPRPSYFRNHFWMPDQRVELQSPVHLRDFVVSGKLELSLKDYLELVMENNTDIRVQILNVQIPKDAIMRAYGQFDPVLTGSFQSTRASTPPTSKLVEASILTTLTQPAKFGISQTLETGTSYSVGFSAEKDTTNDANTTWNPALQSALTASFSQPLLRNRGSGLVRLPIVIAQGNRHIAENSLKDKVLTAIQNAENAYWDVVQARENLKVQEESLKMNDTSLKLYQRELELGALSPLDIYLPQSQYAAAETSVIQAKYSLAQVEDALRKQIAADLDPEVRNLPIVLTEDVLPPAGTSSLDKNTAVERALKLRPDLWAVIGTVDVDDLQIKQAGNAMRPNLALTGGYNSMGRGGTYFSGIGPPIPGGMTDALGQVFGFQYSTYAFGLTLSMPLRDHTAAANLADTLVQKKMDSLSQRSLEQNIRLQVFNAVDQVESAKASIQSATTTRDFAQKALEAEQKKYELGTNTLFFVLDAETRLVTAESNLLTQSISYRRNLLNLLRMTGELLDARGVAIQ